MAQSAFTFGSVDVISKAIVDAKGDLIVGTAADTVGRLPVGANDEVPVAASGDAEGIVWQKIANAQVATTAAIALSKLAIAACHAKTTAAKNVPQSTDTVMDLAAEDYDTNAMHDNVTNNSRVTVPRAGKYFVKAHIVYDVTTASGNAIYTFLYKNGSEIKRIAKNPTSTAAANDVVVVEVLDLAANDYLEVFAHSSSQAISASAASLTVVEQAA